MPGLGDSHCLSATCHPWEKPCLRVSGSLRFAQAQNTEAPLRAHSVWSLGASRRRWAGPRWAEPAVLWRADTAQAPAPWPQPGARMRRVPLPAGRGVARTRASRRDVLRRATPDITGLCVVAARLSSAASPGEGGAAFAGGAAGDKDDPRRTIQWQSRRFRFAASPAPDDAGPWLPPHRPSLPRGPRGCSYPEAVKRPRAARPLPHVKQVGPAPRPAPGFCCVPSGLRGPVRRRSWGAR